MAGISLRTFVTYENNEETSDPLKVERIKQILGEHIEYDSSVLEGKVLLITGGAGSFGNAVIRRFLNTEIKENRVLSHDEKKLDDMRRHYGNDKLKFYIGDVRNLDSIIDAFWGVDFVFHAAALKQVPSCEFYPMEALRTNVEGSDNVITACVRNHVKKAMFLSTDKAAYPINAMGMSKVLMEKVVIARSRQMPEDDRTLCLVHYGNVMGSRGSVIPLFLEQIKEGKSLTITNPFMMRFMMSLEEAVNLVLYDFEKGEQRDLFVQKSPATTLSTLARTVLSITKSHSKVVYIGTRHGENLYETLVAQEEMSKAVDMGRFYFAKADNRDLNYEKYYSLGNKSADDSSSYNSHNARQLSIEEMISMLKKLDIFK